MDLSGKHITQVEAIIGHLQVVRSLVKDRHGESPVDDLIREAQAEVRAREAQQ